MAVRIGVSGASAVARRGNEPFYSYLDKLETQGWDSIWFSDRIVGPGWTLDPLVGMAIVAARTTKLKIGTGVLLMSMRSPVTTARALAAIDFISEGRLVVGVGVGQEAPIEYEAMGILKKDRGKRLDEAIRIMRQLWAGDDVNYEGHYQSLSGASVHPKPYRGGIPIWIGGRTEAAFRRAGRIGDGWLPTQVTPKDVAWGIGRIKEYAAREGNVIEEDHYGLQAGCYIVERGSLPLEKISQYLLRRRQDVSIGELNFIGTPDQVKSRLNEYVDAGATKFVLTPACPPEELDSQLDLQAETLVKYFHSDAE